MGKNWNGFIVKLKFCEQDGKPCYDKKGAVSAKNKRWEDEHIALRIYQCDYGDHWHLTSYDVNREIKKYRK